MTGWRCPVCGAGCAPYLERCPCVPMSKPVKKPEPERNTDWDVAPTWPSGNVVMK